MEQRVSQKSIKTAGQPVTWVSSIGNSNMTSFFRFVNKQAIYRLGIISLEHVPLHVTDFSVVNVPVDELSSARIWQHKLCATLSANVNIKYRLKFDSLQCPHHNSQKQISGRLNLITFEWQ